MLITRTNKYTLERLWCTGTNTYAPEVVIQHFKDGIFGDTVEPSAVYLLIVQRSLLPAIYVC